MHGSSQNVNYEGGYISDEEFHDAEENDLSDLESIPSPSLFQTHNLSGSTSLGQSTINYYGNTYQGGVKGNKLSGFGKLSSKNKKEYIEGIWRNSQLIEVFSCQFIHFIRSTHSRNEMRIYGKDNLFIFDRGNFVAKIKFGELKELDFARPLNPLSSGRGFLEKITITKVLEDELLNKRDAALEKFLQNAGSMNTENLLQFYKILGNQERVFSYQGTLNLNEDILSKIISNQCISEELRSSARQLLEAEQLLSNRNKGFPEFDSDIRPNLPNLLHKLRAIYKEGISNYIELLLGKCPHYRHSLSGLMIQSIYGLHDQKILYLSDKDIQLFSDLTVLADPKHLERLWHALLKKVQQANSKSLKDIGPLTNPIYLYLFKSLQELITEISNTAEIPKEDLLKVDSAGNWSVLESIKWSKSSRTTCSIEQQYYFIFELMQHFEPLPLS